MVSKSESVKGCSADRKLLTFHAKIISTGPIGSFRMNRLNPFSGSPSVSFKESPLILSRYSPLATAVVISFAVYAMGLPICSVSSFANSSCLSVRSFSAFLTMACRSEMVVFLNDKKASVATFGRASISAFERPLRTTTGLLVVGDIVVIFSTDIFVSSSIYTDGLCKHANPGNRTGQHCH